MSPMALPPGFRFHPTDDELVGYYLKRKVDGMKIELEVIPAVELYKFDPWELPDKSFLPKRDMEWFFFCPRDRKYPNGSRTNRATASGYWKATGKDRRIVCEPSVAALRKTLVFYRGRAPGGERTDWVMHEYRLCEDPFHGSPNFVGAYALCRIVKRNEHGQKTGDLQGESKAKRDLSTAMNVIASQKYFDNVFNVSEENDSQVTSSFGPSNQSTSTNSPDSGRGVDSQPILTEISQASIGLSYGRPSNASKDISTEYNTLYDSIVPNEFHKATEACPPCNLSPVSSYSSFTEESFWVDELNEDACLPPFPNPIDCMGLLNNEESLTLQNFEWYPQRHMNASNDGLDASNSAAPAVICRQASEEEEVNLWLQEDNLLIVM